MKHIAIYGAGGLGREIMMLIRQINLQQPQWHLLGFFDDKFPEVKSIHGLPVLGDMAMLNLYDSPINLVVAIGNPGIKQAIVQHISNPNISFPTLIHPQVQAETFQNLAFGEGSIITAGNILTVDVHIGKHVLVNLSCTIGHDVRIGDYSSLMPGVHVSGNIQIGEGVFIGTGAKLINQIHLEPFSVVGAGALVRENIAGGTTVAGVPAVPIKSKR